MYRPLAKNFVLEQKRVSLVYSLSLGKCNLQPASTLLRGYEKKQDVLM